MSHRHPSRKSIAIFLMGAGCLTAAPDSATAFHAHDPGPAFQLAQASLTPGQRRERARRALMERRDTTTPPRLQTQRGNLRLGASQDDGALAKVKATLEKIPALKGLKLLDLKKGPGGYSAGLGTKSLAIAVFPAGKPVPAGLTAARRSGPRLGSRRGAGFGTIAGQPQGRRDPARMTQAELRERARRAIEARGHHLVEASRLSREHLRARARKALEARERRLKTAEHSAKAVGERALHALEEQKRDNPMPSSLLPGAVREHLPPPIKPHGKSPAALTPTHRNQHPARLIDPRQANITPRPAPVRPSHGVAPLKPDNHPAPLSAPNHLAPLAPHNQPSPPPDYPGGHWNVAFTESAFSFAAMAKGRFGPLEDVHVRSLSMVVSAIDNAVALADFPRAFQPSMRHFADSNGIVTLQKGVNLFGEIARFTGMLDTFRREFGIKGGTTFVWGSVGGDFVRHFANGKAESTSLDLNDVRVGIDLPGIRPVPLEGVVDSGPVHLTFHATKSRIEATGQTRMTVRLGGRTVTVDGTLVFDDKPAVDKDFVTVKGNFPKPQELLARLTNLDLTNLKVTRLGADFRLIRRKDNKTAAEFDLDGIATFRNKPVTMTGTFDREDKNHTTIAVTIKSKTLSFADLVPTQVAPPGLDQVKIEEVRLRNTYVSTTARFKKEDTTVYIFRTKAAKYPNILILHDKFRFSDYVPLLKGTPVDDAGQLDNAMFLYVPQSNASGNGGASFTLADLPKPVLPYFSIGGGGGKRKGGRGSAHSGGGRIDLKAGLNFFGHLDLKAPGTVKTMLEKIGLNKLERPHLPLSGVLDPQILNPAKPQAKKIALQIIESLDITAPLPDFKPPRFPGGMSFKNVVLSLKGEKAADQQEHAQVDVSVKGDISLRIRGKPLALSGGLEIDKEIGGAAKALKFTAVAKHDWNHPLGLNWLSVKKIGLSADLGESAQKSKDLDFKLDAMASISRKQPVKIEGELVVVNDKLDDVIFRIPSKIDVKNIPHIGRLPGVNQFSFANLAISSRELAGDLTWKPKNITQKAALYFDGDKHDQVALFYSLENFSIGKLIPPLARTKIGNIALPKFVLTLSTHPMMPTTLGQLPQEVQKILASVSKDPTYPMRIAQGVGIMAPLDPKKLGGEIKSALDHLNVKDAVVLGGGVGGIFGGPPHLDLKARLPRVPIPKKLPKFLRFTKDAGGALYLAYAGETMDLGVEVDADMILGLADRTPKLVSIQLGVELGGSGGVGLRTTGSVQGRWKNAMGMIGMDLDAVTFKFGVDADSAVEVGMSANEIVEGNHIDYAILVAVIPEIVTPTKLAFSFDAQEFGLSTYLAMGDVYLKTSLAQPFFATLLSTSLKKLGAKKAAKSIDWYENEIKKAPSLNQLLPLGDLPLIHFKRVKANLVMPGSGDPQLNLQPGVGLGGQLWLGKTELGKVDASLTFLGLKVDGDVALKHIGPLRIDKARVDIDATLGLDPHFKIIGDARMFGTRQEVEIYVGKKGLDFERINDLGPMGKLTWKAKTQGPNLSQIKDFTIDGRFGTRFPKWLSAALVAEIQAGSKGLEHIASDVEAAQNALNHIKALAKARQAALKAAKATLDAVNKKVENLPGGRAAVKFEKWLLGELNKAKDRVDAAKKALIKDSEILAYEAAHEAAQKAEALIKNSIGSLAVNSATIHGSLRDSILGKPIKLHLDATASGHQIVTDLDFPLANPRNLNVAAVVRALYHVVKSDLFGKKA